MYFQHCVGCDKDFFAQAGAPCPNCFDRPWLAKKDVEKIMDETLRKGYPVIYCGKCGTPRPASSGFCGTCLQKDLHVDVPLKPVAPTALDKQVGGDHYKKYGDYQPWAVYAKWFSPDELRGAMKKEVITYLMREKGGREDIEKAAHTLQLYLELSKEVK